MELESLKRIDFFLKVKQEKTDQFSGKKKKKPKLEETKGKKQSRIDMRV